MLKIIDSGPLSVSEAMEKDAYLLETLDPSGPLVLHFYDWVGPCVTYGHFIHPAAYLRLDQLALFSLQVARRPTGGGIIFHFDDFSFSVLVPQTHPKFSINTLENYHWINQSVMEALHAIEARELSLKFKTDFSDRSGSKQLFLGEKQAAFCMARPTPFDLLVNGKKVGGAAQRKRRHGLLHQCSICLIPYPRQVLEAMVKDPHFLEAMERESTAWFETPPNPSRLNAIRSQLKEQLAMRAL